MPGFGIKVFSFLLSIGALIILFEVRYFEHGNNGCLTSRLEFK